MTEKNSKLCQLFHDFIHNNEQNGIEDVIREVNGEVAGEDVDARIMLDEGYGEKYFYKCMELAEKVIESFEREESSNEK